MESKVTILEKGDLTVTLRDVKRYDTDCDLLMREIGEVITNNIAIPSNKYLLTFFLPGMENMFNLMNIQDTHSLVNTLFTIVYDKDLNFESYRKREKQIPKDMRYMVLAY